MDLTRRKAGGLDLKQEEQFYHGTIFGGLDRILANANSHVDGGKVAYFTTDRVYALVCCRSKAEKQKDRQYSRSNKQSCGS